MIRVGFLEEFSYRAVLRRCESRCWTRFRMRHCALISRYFYGRCSSAKRENFNRVSNPLEYDTRIRNSNTKLQHQHQTGTKKTSGRI